MDKFLERWGLPELSTERSPKPPGANAGPGGRAGGDEIHQLRQLRSVLRSIVEELIEHKTISDNKLEQLNCFMTPVTSYLVLERNDQQGFQLRTESLNPASASAEIARSFATLIAESDWRRLKVCANESCRWAYFDESRNRSRRWCDSKLCGNVMKVRAFRKRKSDDGDSI